jgi:Na+/H+ antiporter
MGGGRVHAMEIVFLLLMLFVVVFASLAGKLKLPYPIVLVVAGLVLGFVPGIPKITLNPDVIFLAVLPPLLYSAAWLTSWRDFSDNIVSILLLAFGLVAFTVIGVSEAAYWSVAPFDRRLGFVLGAVVATTDAIAATSIAKRVGLPRRLVDILEGESLVNDATGLLALEFGVAMVMRGEAPSPASGLIRLISLIVIGIGIGLAIALLVQRIERHLDDGPVEIVLSIMVPYAAYLGAEAAHGSGVLAVVACGLYLGRRGSLLFSPGVRLQAHAFWEAFTFALNGLVFVLIGLQLPFVLAGIHEYPVQALVLYGVLFSILVIVLRLVWVFPGAYGAYLIRRHLFHRDVDRPSPGGIFVVGWTGMRGVIALAAAMSLPEALADGSPFPHRNLIIFLTFCAILVTLVVQGLTLPPLIRILGLGGAAGTNPEEQDARRIMLETALEYLDARRAGEATHHLEGAYQEATARYRRRLAAITRSASLHPNIDAEDHALSAELIRLERETALRLRDEGRINDDVLRQLERELDLNQTRLDFLPNP